MNVNASLVILIVLTVGNYWLRRSVLYPPFVFCAMWLIAVALTASGIIETDPIQSKAWWIFTGGALVFSVSGALALLCPKIFVETRFVVSQFPRRNKVFKTLLCLLLLCGFPLMLQNLRAEAAQGTGGTFLERARNGGITAQRNGEGIDGSAPGFTIYFLQWSIFAAIIFMLESRDKAFWFMAALALLYSIMSTGRTTILQLFAGLICVHLIQTKRTTFWAALKITRLPLALFFFLYIGLVFVNKRDTTQYYATSVVEIAVFFLVSYIVGPLAAFSVFIESPASLQPTSNYTFKFFLLIAAKLHLISYVAPGGLEGFVNVPYPINVFTLYKDYILDFGLAGSLVAIAVIAFTQVLLFRKAMSGSFIGTFLFALTIFPLVMSLFSNLYSSMGLWTDATMFAMLYVFLQSRSIRVLPRLCEGYGVSAPIREVPETVA